MTSNKDLLDYIFYLNVQNLDKTQGANLLVGVDTARVNVLSSGKGYGK
jgi:mRNA deadenylase 3'-5' endonuclease subunit Ccr4